MLKIYDYGTTKYFLKSSLILKGIFYQKYLKMRKSITWQGQVSKDGLRGVSCVFLP
jgi:hypothetical protein